MAVFKAETRRRLSEQDRRWKLKLGLRSVSTFFAFLAFLLFAITTGLSVHYYGGTDWTDAMPLAPVLLALVYNPLHIVAILHSAANLDRPISIHPAWPLTVDTLIWALSIPSLVFSIGVGWFMYWAPVQLEIEGIIPCMTIYDFYSKECNPMIYTLGRMEIAANVFLALILIAHFVLFIYSCMSAHQHRLARRAARRSRRNIELQPSPTNSNFNNSQRQSQQPKKPQISTITESHPPPAYSPSAPRLVSDFPSSPASPINSGSGGGFFGASGWGRTDEPSSPGAAKKEAKSEERILQAEPVQQQQQQPRGTADPFSDQHAVKYA